MHTITLWCWSDKASMSSESIPKVDLSYLFKCNGWYRPSDKGGGHPDPEIRGRAVSKKCFSAFRASFWSKNKEGPGSLPGSATKVHSFFFFFCNGFKKSKNLFQVLGLSGSCIERTYLANFNVTGSWKPGSYLRVFSVIYLEMIWRKKVYFSSKIQKKIHVKKDHNDWHLGWQQLLSNIQNYLNWIFYVI